jgi:hypothetical protein
MKHELQIIGFDNSDAGDEPFKSKNVLNIYRLINGEDQIKILYSLCKMKVIN